jgi:hypothetical protein
MNGWMAWLLQRICPIDYRRFTQSAEQLSVQSKLVTGRRKL